MIRPGRVASVLILTLVLTLLLSASATAADSGARQVIIVLAPYITWDDITSGAMPATRELAARGTVGNLNPRSSARFLPAPTPPHIALTMSAGSPAAFDPLAPPAYNAAQPLDIGTAAQSYVRSMGTDPKAAAIVYLGLPRVLRANQTTTLDTVPGALGQAIVDAGGATGAVGNSDGGYIDGMLYRSRPAAVLAMDATGLVNYGDISADVLEQDQSAPYGLTTNMPAFEAAYAKTLSELAGHGGPGLVVLDPGDAERAFNFTADASPDAAEAHRLRAAARIDAVVALAMKTAPKDAVIMVVPSGQARPSAGPSGFGPVIISGAGFDSGLVSSPSTHRKGLMTDLDVSATVLGILGIDRPVEILGNACTAGWSSANAVSRYGYLKAMQATAIAVDTVRPAVQNSYITITVIVLLACAALLAPMQRSLSDWGSKAARLFSNVILFLLSMPVAATLMYVFTPRPETATAVALSFSLTTLGVFAVVRFAEHWGSAIALATVGLLSAGVLIADQLAGAPLSFSGMFSYSPLLGARYYGIGNEGASILVGAALAGLALFIDAFRDRPWMPKVRTYVPVVLGALAVVVSAAPFLGANVGVVAWGTVAFAILWTQVNGKRVTWRTLLVIGVIIVGLIAAFSAFDLLSPGGGQTHLGRAWQSAESGGVGELWTIVARKAETNWRVLRATNWSILMIAILAFLGFLRWRPQGVFAETLKAYPAFAVAMTASLWASLVGYFTEDSGIVIPALVMLYITGSLLHVMLSRMTTAKDVVQA